VAARVRAQDGEENWILAEIVSYNSNSNKYDVDDIDAEEGKELVLFVLIGCLLKLHLIEMYISFIKLFSCLELLLCQKCVFYQCEIIILLIMI